MVVSLCKLLVLEIVKYAIKEVTRKYLYMQTLWKITNSMQFLQNYTLIKQTPIITNKVARCQIYIVNNHENVQATGNRLVVVY